MRRIWIWAVAALLGATYAGEKPAVAATQVKVGGYEFTPYLHIDASLQATGLSLDLLALLNKVQTRYEFVFVPTAPARRYADFAAGKFDFVVFEDFRWRWADQPIAVAFSRVLLRHGDRYVAEALPGRGQEYFNAVGTKRVIGTRGYHFGFAGMESDPDTLAAHYNIQLVNSGDAAIEMVLRKRGDVAVVTGALIGYYLKQHPELKGRLLVSNKFDNEYALSIIGRRDAAPSMDELNGYLDELERSGALTELYQRYGITSK